MADPSIAIDPTTLSHGHSPYVGNHTPPTDLFALAESYSTGIMLLDAVLCLVLSVLVQQLVMLLQNDGDKSQTLLPMLWKYIRGDDAWIERRIEVTERYSRDGYRVWDYEQTNYLLQKAISLYLADKVTYEKQEATYELFTKPKDNTTVDEDVDKDERTLEEMLEYGDDEISSLAVKTLPTKDWWIEVEPGVFFKHQEMQPPSSGESRTGKETKIIFRLKSKRKNGSARIEALITKAFAQYQETERAKVTEDKKRYFYIQSGTTAAKDNESKQVVAYKRYALGEEKTFENLFFDNKDHVLQLLDNFATKSGKFAIKGFPYKLGFLLHGPPGTGKTSLIKAIAHHTKRHIVTINLGKIKTNQELMDAIFDLTFAVDGLDSPVEYTFKDVIFVMEDIDCASSIVNKRTTGETAKTEESGLPSELRGVANSLMLKAGVEASKNEATEIDEDGKETKSSSTDAPSGEKKLMQMMLKMVMDDDKKSSELNLAGLLNVLDGVIDCPGRIIVMTTNHPEKLDPALIRPGRINKKLLLSYMNATQVSQMIAYYTQTTLDATQMQRLEKVFAVDAKLVSPAEVEEMCAEFDSTDKIIEGLEKVAFASRF